MQLDPKHLAALAAVVEQGSFEQAARWLSLTQGSISLRIRALEERLGGPVVVRSQPIRLTELGQVLYRHYQELQLLSAELAARLPQLNDERPRIRIALNADSLATWFLDAVAQVKDKLLVDLQVSDQDVTHEKLKDGEVLAAVSAFGQAVQGCNANFLGAMPYTAIASPDYASEYFPKGPTSDAFRQATAMVYGHHDRLLLQFLNPWQLKDGDFPVHTMPAAQSFVDAAIKGLAWTLVPVWQAQEALDSGKVVELTPKDRIKVRLYWHHRRLDAGPLQSLTEAVMAATLPLRK
ncbi:LysR family transcriptional regulator ArgP [Gallaecimonas xiamenensis]|uniref:Chromosome replication initiation inhibitor protein n=1 Tax=Gallaecimonas xiamenensis 3-C-1 TaxID=745411 RepID=K2JRN6_9GAMM|nr:LysR family transcriptional regulator ArgP [Gallaecimonas xiamenensis]EKE77142.1 chromosome replication initiation inhibitor protein [Gallaecimonas xiamenensis 3-C-1]